MGLLAQGPGSCLLEPQEAYPNQPRMQETRNEEHKSKNETMNLTVSPFFSFFLFYLVGEYPRPGGGGFEGFLMGSGGAN